MAIVQDREKLMSKHLEKNILEWHKKNGWFDGRSTHSEIALDIQWNLKQEGFTYEEILEGMRNTLNEILKKNHIPHVYPVKRGKFND